MSQCLDAEIVSKWERGVAPIAVIMISLNEAHNMQAVLDNLKGWAQEVFLVDSYSADNTVDIAIANGVYVVQRKFRGFGDQWNFALDRLPITAPWVMKLDPDERLTDDLKHNIETEVNHDAADGISFCRRLWFMGEPLPLRQEIVRVWRVGCCRFTHVKVNEHPLVTGKIIHVKGDLEHHDSPDLHHWVDKQNRYTSLEAIGLFENAPLAVTPMLLGSKLERRMWFKANFVRFPLRYFITYIMNLIQVRVWKSGRVGFAWTRLRVWARRMKEDKLREMNRTGKLLDIPPVKVGCPHPGAFQAESLNEE